MGDRTSVYLYVPKWAEPVMKHLEPAHGAPETWGDASLTRYGGYFEECNYGEVGMEAAFHKLEIPFDKTWYAGSEYGPGEEVARIDKAGIYRTLELSDTDLAVTMRNIMRTGDPSPVLEYIAKWRECFDVPLDQCPEPPGFQARWKKFLAERGEEVEVHDHAV